MRFKVAKVWFRTLFLFAAVLPALHLTAQSQIPGAAPVVLEALDPDCNGRTAVVSVQVDLTDLTGNGGPAGLNAFVLAFDLDRADVLASAVHGTDPNLHWQLIPTRRDLVNLTNRLILVGHVADPNAPDQNYHVLTLRFSGTAGPLTLSLDTAASSLGSRVVAGDGPGPIALSNPGPLTLTIPLDFDLSLDTALPLWLEQDADYDLDPADPQIDIRDLARLILCGG